MPGEEIKIYADEDIPARVVQFLRNEFSWNVRYVCEEENLQKKDDLYHYRRAREENRIILTRDKDYLDPIRFPFHKSSGVIIIEEKNVDRMISLLHYLPSFLKTILKGRSRNRPSFLKIIFTISGARVRFEGKKGVIEEKSYSWRR